MAPKKPTGQIGNISFCQATHPTIEWKLIHFSECKDQIEEKIIDYFVTAGTAAGFKILEVTQNIENDIDFSLTLPGGNIDLELSEIVYSIESGNPYQSRSNQINCVEFSRQIINLITKKSSKYSKNNIRPIDLLLYITHWAFLPNELVIRLAQHELNSIEHIFENVFLLIPLDQKNANLRPLYPSENPLEGRSSEEFQDSTYVNVDPENVSFIKNGELG